MAILSPPEPIILVPHPFVDLIQRIATDDLATQHIHVEQAGQTLRALGPYLPALTVMKDTLTLVIRNAVATTTRRPMP